MDRLKIKVCGMRDPANIRAVEALGIDIMGFIFYPKSSRYIASRPRYLPQSCRRAGVFVDATISEVASIAEDFALDFVQLHGNENTEYIRRLRRLTPAAVIKAVHIASVGDIHEAETYAPYADLLLFDTACSGYGGSGCSFDWSLLSAYSGGASFILSGGIGSESAPDILGLRHPMLWGIDVNSRFEIGAAMKDTELLKNFINTIRQ